MKRPGYFRGLAILAFALLFVGAVLSVDWPSPAGLDEQNDTVRNEDVGRAMFGVSGASGYGLIMVFIGVLLLVALLGGIFLAKEEKEEDQ
jgi:NADH:ubiquinone oxidoreductase subunit 6 (subunit J)